MSNVTPITFTGPRQDQINMLQEIVASCIYQTANEVGIKQVQAFFSGYKENVDELKKAA